MTTEKILSELHRKEEEDVARILSKKYGVAYLDGHTVPVDIDSLKIIPEKEAREAEIAIIDSVGKKLRAATPTPNNPAIKKTLEDLKNKKYDVTLFLVSKSGFQKIAERFRDIPKFREIKPGVVEISVLPARTIPDLAENFKKLLKKPTAQKASEVLELLLQSAIALEASDIHVEPEEEVAAIRFRLDGVLHTIADMPKELYTMALSRIKLTSEVKLNIHDKPQDGRFTIRRDGSDIEVRTAFLPGPHGESAVMRILLPKTLEITMEHLGMHEKLLATIQHELKKPNGMLIATGPTGSGKTTTLYSFLKKVSSPTIKIITIEDPIEYHLPNVTQTQVNHEKGYAFANGLGSILRQDPDVILVGEIRDKETASTAMHASLTGHLVFTTLHTNDAAGTIPRLIDLGIDPAIIAPAINVALAQRLIRMLCESCKKKIKPSPEEERAIREHLKNIAPVSKNFFVWKAGACEACNHTGYKGRIGVFEAIIVDEEMERLILTRPPEADIKKVAAKTGTPTMFQDGLLKVLAGITSFEELARVVSDE